MAGTREAPPRAEQTLELRVENMSFLLEQLGRDCAPDQLIRELTVNAIQAAQATERGAGLVAWVEHPGFATAGSARKLAILDTGTGMTGPEMVRYINHLAASGRVQSEEGNFGVGAKIAAATRNPAGMVYLSWKDGEGAMIWFWRNPETGQYGLKPLPRGDGTEGYWAPVPDALKPASIGEHGTLVVLLGTGDDDDTATPPGDAASGDALWLARYLNTRFLAFPEGIEVRAPELPVGGREPRAPREIGGMGAYLAAASDAAGVVDLGDARAHWWILPEGEPPAGSDAYLATGHVGALFQDEIYELYSGRSGTAKLQGFGVAVGHHRVVLYLEPKRGGGRRVNANTARTALLMGGRPLPWAEWAQRFRESLPEEILRLMEEVADARDDRDRTQSFKERMKSLANLLFIGGAGADEKLLQLFGPARGPRASQEPGREPALVPEEDAAEDRAEGEAVVPEPPARRDAEPPAPRAPALDLDRLLELEVAWVSESECGAYERAGHYIEETNTLLMNRDFRVFREYVDRWRGKYAGNPAAQREVEDLVREWLEQPLRELVIRSHFLRGSEGWSDESIAALLSDEALTAVSLPCYLTEMRLRAAVSSRLGRLRAA